MIVGRIGGARGGGSGRLILRKGFIQSIDGLYITACGSDTIALLDGHGGIPPLLAVFHGYDARVSKWCYWNGMMSIPTLCMKRLWRRS